MKVARHLGGGAIKSQAHQQVSTSNDWNCDACAIPNLRRSVSFFDGQTYTDREHQEAPCVSVEGSWEPARCSGLSAARLQAFFPTAVSSPLSAGRPKRFRCCNLVFGR